MGTEDTAKDSGKCGSGSVTCAYMLTAFWASLLLQLCWLLVSWLGKGFFGVRLLFIPRFFPFRSYVCAFYLSIVMEACTDVLCSTCISVLQLKHCTLEADAR